MLIGWTAFDARDLLHAATYTANYNPYRTWLFIHLCLSLRWKSSSICWRAAIVLLVGGMCCAWHSLSCWPRH